jgi:hypothetical protein
MGTYVLTLPSGLIIQLENCYYVPVSYPIFWPYQIFYFLLLFNLLIQKCQNSTFLVYAA